MRTIQEGVNQAAWSGRAGAALAAASLSVFALMAASVAAPRMEQPTPIGCESRSAAADLPRIFESRL